MKILVTGHRGFIAGHMVQALGEHEVTTYEYGDALPTISGLDWIIHMGAISSTTERDVDKVMRQNYESSVDLYDSAVHFGVNFQFASSASVYGLISTFREDAPVDPKTPYAWSKYIFERYMNNNPPTNSVAQCFRYFNVYGPEGEAHKGTQASPYYQFQQQARMGQIKLFEGSERFQRDFVPVSTIVDYHKQFFDVDESGVWNLGTGTATSFLSVASLFDCPIVSVPMPDILKSSYQAYTCADMTKTLATVTKR